MMRWMTLLLPNAALLLLLQHSVLAKKTVVYDVPGPHCGENRQRIDSVVLKSNHHLFSSPSNSSPAPFHSTSPVASCVMKFEADDGLFTSKRLMVNVRRLNMTGCTASLKLYYHAEIGPNPDLTLDCHSALVGVGHGVQELIETGNRHLVVRLDSSAVAGVFPGDTGLHPSGGGAGGPQFELVITAYRTATQCQGEFLCANRRCIDKDLYCDQIDHCTDRSDENCPIIIVSERQGHASVWEWCVTSASALFLICLFCCLCCRCQQQPTFQGRVISTQPITEQYGGIQGHVISTQPATALYPAAPPGYYNAAYTPGLQNLSPAQQQCPPYPTELHPLTPQPAPAVQPYGAAKCPPAPYPTQYQTQ